MSHLVVLLPNAASRLPRFEKKLTNGELKRWFSDLAAASARRAIVTLPKMHIEWRSNLVPVFKALGATTAFGDYAECGHSML